MKDSPLYAAAQALADKLPPSGTLDFAIYPYQRELSLLRQALRDEVGWLEKRVDDVADAFSLTKKEKQILWWIVQGKGSSEIMGILGFKSVTRACNHKTNIKRKLGVETDNAIVSRVYTFMGLRK